MQRVRAKCVCRDTVRWDAKYGNGRAGRDAKSFHVLCGEKVVSGGEVARLRNDRNGKDKVAGLTGRRG